MTLHKAANVNVQNKVVLTQEQYDEIQKLIKYGWEISNIITAHTNFSWQGDGKILNDLTLDTLIRVLYRPEDITIEQTVEEQLLEFHKVQKNSHPEDQIRTELAIEKVLNIIGMKVKGINA